LKRSLKTNACKARCEEIELSEDKKLNAKKNIINCREPRFVSYRNETATEFVTESRTEAFNSVKGGNRREDLLSEGLISSQSVCICSMPSRNTAQREGKAAGKKGIVTEPWGKGKATKGS